MHEKVLKAFEGTLETQPLEVRVKLGDKRKKMFVSMGEIRIPAMKDLVDIEMLEEEYECKVARHGKLYIVTPKVVKEIINKEGVLSSYCEEHRRKLREWMQNHGIHVMRYFIELE